MSVTFEPGNRVGVLTITAESDTYEQATSELWQAIQERKNFSQYIFQVSVQDQQGNWRWFNSTVESGSDLNDEDAFFELEGLVSTAIDYPEKGKLSLCKEPGIQARIITW